MRRASVLLCAVMLMVVVRAAAAADLLQAWQAAQQHDPEYAAARAAHEAGGARRAQAQALWRPSVVLNAGVGRMSSDSNTSGARFAAPGFGQSTGVAFDTSINNGNLDRYSLVVTQPLINRERMAQSRQLALGADMADAEWQNARQSLMLRVAERYFDVLVASETVRMLQQQQKAVQSALTEARDRFQLGDKPVTDTYEASARAETIQAQILAADMDLQVKQTAYADLTGTAAQGLATLRPGPDPAPSGLSSAEHWISEATRRNPRIVMQARSQAVAREEAAKYSALASPKLDLIAQMGRERLRGSGDFGDAENRSSNRMVGVQLTIPLFTGGYRSAQQEEALRLVDKAHAEGEHLRQQIALQTRTAWLGLTVGASRVAALEQARKASEARLDATRLGQSVGDRTTLDLLNAENEATGAELALLQARIAVALNRLRLAALAGTLNEETLRSVNSTLQSSSGH